MRLKNLQLDRPLIALDTETTGLLPGGRVVEIAAIKIYPPGSSRGGVLVRRVNPRVPIPAVATRCHGITDADVRDCPTWEDVWADLMPFCAGCDWLGFNLLGFDLPIVQGECERHELDAGALFRDRSLIDPMAIFHFFFTPGRGRGTLSAAVQHYCGRAHVGAHGAEADALAALAVLDHQIEYHDLPRTVQALNQYPFTPAELFPGRSDARASQSLQAPDPAQPAPAHAGLYDRRS
jgi:DNA polymerase III subunit epsilon